MTIPTLVRQESAERPTKWQIKTLSSLLTANGDIAELEFTLEVGKTYRVTINGDLDADPTRGTISLAVKDGATRFASVQATDGLQLQGVSVIRTMTNTSLSIEAIGLTGGSSSDNRIVGDGTTDSTHVIVEELPNHEETTQW